MLKSITNRLGRVQWELEVVRCSPHEQHGLTELGVKIWYNKLAGTYKV